MQVRNEVLIPVYADCIRVLPFTLLAPPPNSSVKRPFQSPTQLVQYICNSIICLASAHPSLRTVAKQAIHQIGTYISKCLRDLEFIHMELVHSAALNCIVQFCDLTCQTLDEHNTTPPSTFTLTTMSVEKLAHWVGTGTSLKKFLTIRFLLPLLEHSVIASENWELASQLIIRLHEHTMIRNLDYGICDWLIFCASSQRFSHARHFFDSGGSAHDESTHFSIDAFLNLRLFSVRVLGEITSNHTQITLSLLAFLNDSSYEIRNFAARALSQRSLAGNLLEEHSDARKAQTACLTAVHIIRMNSSPSVGCYLRDQTRRFYDTAHGEAQWEKVKFSNPYKCLLQVLHDRWMSREGTNPAFSLRENESFGLWAKYISHHLWTCPIHLQHPRWKDVCRKLVGNLAKGLLLFVLECNWKKKIGGWLCIASIVEAVLESSCFQPSYPSCDDKVLNLFRPLLKRMRASEMEHVQRACVVICGKLLGTSSDAFLDPKEPLHYGTLSTLYSILQVESPLDAHDSAVRVRVDSMLKTARPTEHFAQSRPIKVIPSKRTRSPTRTNATMVRTDNGRLGSKGNSAERSEVNGSIGADHIRLDKHGQRIVRRRVNQLETSNRKRGEGKENEPNQNLDSKKSPQNFSADQATCTPLVGNPVSRSEMGRKKYFGRDVSPVKKVCFSDVDDDSDAHFLADPVSDSFGCASDTFPPPNERIGRIHAPGQISKHDNGSHPLKRFSDTSLKSLVLESTMMAGHQPDQDSISEFPFIEDHLDPLAVLQPSLNSVESERANHPKRNRSSQSTSTCIALSAENRFLITTRTSNGNGWRGSSGLNSRQGNSEAETFEIRDSTAISLEPTRGHPRIADELVATRNPTNTSQQPENIKISRSAESISPLTKKGETLHPNNQREQLFGSSTPEGPPPVIYNDDFRYRVERKQLGGNENRAGRTPENNGKRSNGVQDGIPVTGYDGERHSRGDGRHDGMHIPSGAKGTRLEIQRDNEGEFRNTLSESNSLAPSENKELLNEIPTFFTATTDHVSVLPSQSVSLNLQSLESNGQRPVPLFPPNLIRDRVQIRIRKLLKFLKIRQRKSLEIHPLLFQVFGVEPGLLVDACSGIFDVGIAAGDSPWLEQMESISRRLVPLSRILRALEKQLRAPISLAQALIIVRDQIALSTFSAGRGD